MGQVEEGQVEDGSVHSFCVYLCLVPGPVLSMVYGVIIPILQMEITREAWLYSKLYPPNPFRPELTSLFINL